MKSILPTLRKYEGSSFLPLSPHFLPNPLHRYADVFVTTLWPFTPLHRAVANTSLLDNYLQEEKRGVLSLNISVVLSTGLY